jgi:hypothetical protein
VNAVAIMGVAVAAAGVRLWLYGRLPRPTAWVLAFGFVLLGIGIPVWTDTLASLTKSQTGQYALMGVLFVTGVSFYVEAVHKPRKPKIDGNGVMPDQKPDHYHRVTTMATASVFGTALVVAIVRWATLRGLAKNSPSTVRQTFRQQAAFVKSGQAAASITASTEHLVLLGAFLIFTALVALLVWYERRKPEKVAEREAKERARDRKKEKKAIGSGRAMSAEGGR